MKNISLKIIYSVLMRCFLKLIVGTRFDNSRFLKKIDQFIIVANHNSHLDTMTLMASLPASVLPKVKPVAALDHFGKTKLSRFFAHNFVNALLIKRKRDKDNPLSDPIHQMIKAIDEGYSLILYPEGTRGLPEVMQSLKAGVAIVLAQRPHVQLVPAFMSGMGLAMPKGDSLIVPFNSSLTFGKAQAIVSSQVEDIMGQIKGRFEELSQNARVVV